jgi:hypothetical protein
MALLYEVSRRHGEKVLTKIKEENNLTDDEFNHRLTEIAQQAQRGMRRRMTKQGFVCLFVCLVVL